MSRDLPLSLVTPDQIQSVLLDLSHFRDAQTDAKVRAKVGAKNAESLPLSPELTELLPDAPTDSDLDEIAQWLQKIRDEAPVVHVVLPAVATKALKQALIHWFRERIDPSVLLDFEVDREIAGGFIVRVGGRVYDYSFRKRLLEKKAVIARLYHGR